MGILQWTEQGYRDKDSRDTEIRTAGIQLRGQWEYCDRNSEDTGMGTEGHSSGNRGDTVMGTVGTQTWGQQGHSAGAARCPLPVPPPALSLAPSPSQADTKSL